MATKKRTAAEKVKTGPKSDAEKKDIEAKLRELYLKDGITIQRASIEAGCSAPHASEWFKKFGAELAQHAIDVDENWLEKNDRVRVRALEGIAVQVVECDKKLSAMNMELKTAKEMQVNILPNAMEKLMDTDLGVALEGAISKLDGKTYLAIVQMISNDINMWKNYGYYVQTVRNNIRAEVILQAEFQQQYDTIEILPPPSEILDKMIERHIAEKNGLVQPKPEDIPEEKPVPKVKSKPKTKKKVKTKK